MAEPASFVHIGRCRHTLKNGTNAHFCQLYKEALSYTPARNAPTGHGAAAPQSARDTSLKHHGAQMEPLHNPNEHASRPSTYALRRSRWPGLLGAAAIVAAVIGVTMWAQNDDARKADAPLDRARA